MSNQQNILSPTGAIWKHETSNINCSPPVSPQRSYINLDHSTKMSQGLDEYHYNLPSFLDSKEEMQAHLCNNLISPPLKHKSKTVNYIACRADEVHLELTVPPETRFRYRYDTEMSGTHGSLQGVRQGGEKCVPTVELVNFPYEALIRVTLATCQETTNHYPHPHSLFVKEKLYQKKIYENWDGKTVTKTSHYSDPHYVRVGSKKNDFLARFEGMCIINSKKENFHVSVREKLQMRYLEQTYGTYKNIHLGMNENEELSNKVEEAVSSVDVDFVRLCFEAFREDNGKLYPICQPIYSEPIGNAKSAKTGKLKISRINKCSGSCKGGDEIWMLVEKINKKGLLVRMWEECNGKTIWQSSIEGDDLILHHQYAIIFKTPVYRDINISTEVEVLMRLERTTQPNQPCDYSEPITFVYEPLKSKFNKGDNLYRKESILTPLKQIHIKRPRTDSSMPIFNYQNKFRSDGLEFESMNFDDSTDSDIEQLLFDDKDSFEFDQAWAKFNVEEFLQFISDDVDMPLQKDGVSLGNRHRRDLLYKLYLLYSKLDESDIKKLTDEISNFRVSKKEIQENKNIAEKDQVKDAASTLLSLRSRAMANSNPKNGSKPNDDTKKTSTVLQLTKTVCPKRIVEPSDDTDLDVPNPVYTSVIKNSLIKTKISSELKCNQNQGKTKEEGNIGEKISIELPKDSNYDAARCAVSKSPLSRDLFNEINLKDIKKEMEVSSSLSEENADKLEIICKILNESGAWEKVADMWDCAHVISSARDSPNPSKFIFQTVERLHGDLELEVLRYILNSINEKEALKVVNGILNQ